MYVRSILLSRFGSRPELSVGEFTPGLNLVLGPPGSGKSAVVDFCRGLWHGFDDSLRNRYASADSPGYGGQLEIQTGDGARVISRVHDESPEGRLTVERSDGSLIGRHHVRDLIGGLPKSLFELVFAVDFERTPKLSDLLTASLAWGHDWWQKTETVERLRESDRRLAMLRDELKRLPIGSESWETLHLRRQRLQQQLEGDRDPAAEQLSGDTSRSHLEERIQELEQREIAAQAELVTREREWSRLQQLVRPLRSDAGQPVPRPRQLLVRLKRLDARLARWSRTLREVVAARQSRADQVRRAEFRNRHGDAADAAPRRSRQAQVAGRRLERCARALRPAIRTLVSRRRLLVRQLAEANAQVSHVEQPLLVDGDLAPGVRAVRTARPRVSPGRLARARRARRRARRRLEAVSSALASLRAHRRASVGPSPETVRRRAQLQEAVAHLDRLLESAHSRRELERQIELQQSESHRLRDELRPLADEASRYLIRLSCGNWRSLQVMSPYDAQVESAAGELVPADDVDATSRDQIYLAACLAVAAACRRRGIDAPLVLNAAFDHFPSHQVAEALTLLREVAAGQQMICLTRHEHVASLARTMHVPVQQLPPPTLPVPDPGRPQTTGQAPNSQPATCYLAETDAIDRVPAIDAVAADRLREAGIVWVRDLLRISCEELAERLRQWGITAEMVRNWQAVARLVSRVTGLSPYDARILVACDVTDPEQLLGMDSTELRRRVSKLASSDDGRTMLLSGTELELSRISDWLQLSVGKKPSKKKQRTSRSPAGKNKVGARPSLVVSSPEPDPSRWHVVSSDRLADIWGNDPQLTRRLAQLGVKTARELVEADPEATAAGLNRAGVTGSTVRRWQQQADLVCRVPQLTTWHLRVLAAVGVASIEALASQVPQELARHLQQFRRTREGARLFAQEHDLSTAQLAEWIQAARSARSRAAA